MEPLDIILLNKPVTTSAISRLLHVEIYYLLFILNNNEAEIAMTQLNYLSNKAGYLCKLFYAPFDSYSLRDKSQFANEITKRNYNSLHIKVLCN